MKKRKWRELNELLSKPPKVEVKPMLCTNKKDKEKAKKMEEIINYMFEHNTNGITEKYMKVMKLCAENFVKEQIDGIRVSWDATQRAVENLLSDQKEK